MRSFGNLNANFGHHLMDFECLAPRDKKESERDVHFEIAFACAVSYCDVTSCVFMFGLCCALYSPILVLA